MRGNTLNGGDFSSDRIEDSCCGTDIAWVENRVESMLTAEQSAVQARRSLEMKRVCRIHRG
jgi:hypothetical protein